MNEFELISKIFLPLTKSIHELKQKKIETKESIPKFDSLDLQDDVALIELNSRNDLVVSKDMMIENVHFLKTDGGFKIASKLLLSNLSDIISSGANPFCYMLGYSKNNSLSKKFYTQFSKALSQIQKKFKIALIGGDTSNSDSLHFSITIFGIAKKDKLLLRKNACNKDLIFVSNTIGDSFLGLDLKLRNLLKINNYEKKLLDKHYYPQPRIELSKKLVELNLSKCATDISDGLVSDLANICKASKLNANIYLSQIPFSLSAKKYIQKNQHLSLLDLISGGEDYELIFSVNPKNIDKIQQLEKKLKLKLTCIGEFSKASISKTTKITTSNKYGVFLFHDKFNKGLKNIIKIDKKGYEHK